MTDLMKHDFEIGGTNDAINMGEADVTVHDIISREIKTDANFTLIEHARTAETTAEIRDEWAIVEENLEKAISVMEEAIPYMQVKTRNEVWHSLHRCYQRAKSIRRIRGIERIEDRSDIARFVDNKCMLGVMI